jgi:hypothetical protein
MSVLVKQQVRYYESSRVLTRPVRTINPEIVSRVKLSAKNPHGRWLSPTHVKRVEERTIDIHIHSIWERIPHVHDNHRHVRCKFKSQSPLIDRQGRMRRKRKRPCGRLSSSND